MERTFILPNETWHWRGGVTMTEICKYCKKPMTFVKEIDDDGYTLFQYRCDNEDCEHQPYKTVHVCDNCESSWEEWN